MASGNELHRKDPIMFSSLSLLCCRSSIIDFQLSLLLLIRVLVRAYFIKTDTTRTGGFPPIALRRHFVYLCTHFIILEIPYLAFFARQRLHACLIFLRPDLDATLPC